MPFEYFTEPELRALPDMDDTATYTTARCTAAHDYVVALIERAVGTSFVSRTVTGEVHDGRGRPAIVLNSPYVLSATSATEGGTTVTDTLRIRGGGVLYRFAAGSIEPTPWALGTGNVSVTYAAGYSATVPADVKEAALKATRVYLLTTDSTAGVDDRMTSMVTDQGTITFSGDPARPTGIPMCDAVILGWQARLDVLGFA